MAMPRRFLSSLKLGFASMPAQRLGVERKIVDIKRHNCVNHVGHVWPFFSCVFGWGRKF